MVSHFNNAPGCRIQELHFRISVVLGAILQANLQLSTFKKEVDVIYLRYFKGMAKRPPACARASLQHTDAGVWESDPESEPFMVILIDFHFIIKTIAFIYHSEG